MKKDCIVKGIWCLDCKHLIDYDVDFEDNMVISCELENEYLEEDGMECPFFEEE